MRTKLIYSKIKGHQGYGDGSGTTELYRFECPCGKGKIIEEHNNIPGMMEHSVKLYCDACEIKYDLNTSLGVRSWKLVEKSVDITAGIY